ncbi:tyrosine-protein kinase family protein [Siculibacillus lacustris]|uniref:Tyrosine-protein kinase family protein n=1 Tax=Siculibacillus lacustris TaxID=1549641 RepID=A0A4Q9VTP7_9HYPH|nr:tyrosine-protein kinase family protein [Siculibacillus lacustris]TBW38989.1 tyrosine-protein kinase family protein [Siculibacillus lacustris]
MAFDIPGSNRRNEKAGASDAPFLQLARPPRRLFVFLGEAGAGKSEIAINLAFALAGAGHPVRFFDLDQTKPLFRSREAAGAMRAAGIVVHGEEQQLDARTVPPGLRDRLGDDGGRVIVDVGGDAQGATMLGQMADVWRDDVAAFLVVNPYRIFAEPQLVADALAAIDRAARVPVTGVVANPNFGAVTTLADVLDGARAVERLIAGTGYPIAAVAAPAPLAARVAAALPESLVLPITRRIVTAWDEAA